MYRPILVLLAVVSALHGSLSKQVPMKDGGPTALVTDTAQLEELQQNISALWSYIHELRGAVTHHLNHLRQHQIEMEENIHRIHPSIRIEPHSHGESHAAAAHTAGHSHSGEDHAHGSSSHSGEDHHHHSGEDHHHHSGEDHHHHSGEHHSHSGEHHDSHSHTDGGDHAHKDDHSHGHAHKDSHENADDLQQTAHGSEPLPEPVIVAATRPPSTNPHSHHHHHSSHSHGGSINLMGEDHFSGASRSRNRTVAMPKLSDSQLYDFAVCNVVPNKALSLEQQQNIVGVVSFWQKKTGGPLNIHVRLSGFSMGGDHHAHQQQGHHEEEEDSNDTDAPPPMVHKHGLHIHALADIANGCQGAGPHYNPKGVTHGGPKSLLRHAGDFGNIECDDHGIANLAFSDEIASLRGPYSVVGKSVVVHAVADDLGLGGDDESLKTGHAGARLACCVVEKVHRLPYQAYRAVKTALQHKNY